MVMSSKQKNPEPVIKYLVNETENTALDQLFDSLFEAVLNGGENKCDSVIINTNEHTKNEG